MISPFVVEAEESAEIANNYDDNTNIAVVALAAVVVTAVVVAALVVTAAVAAA